MDYRNIYQELHLDEFLWGDAFEIEVTEAGVATEDQRIALLDTICEAKDLEPPGKDWNKIDFAQASALLLRSLRYDLAYTDAEIAPAHKAASLHKEILKDLDGSTHCYTNWLVFLGKTDGSSWFPLTAHTFDLGIAFISQRKLIFVLHIGED